MPLPDRAGSYKGCVASAALTKTQKAGLPQLEFIFECEHWRDARDGRWYNVSDYGWTVRGRLILVSGRGEPNEISIEQAMEVFGWDGESFASLEAIASTVKDLPARIYVEPTSYADKNGITKESMEVKSIHHIDWEPGIQGAEKKDINQWDAMYGSALRALPKNNKTPHKKPAATPAPAIAPAQAQAPSLPKLPPLPQVQKKQPDPRSPEEMAEAVKKETKTVQEAIAYVQQHLDAANAARDFDAADYWQAVRNNIDDLPF